MWRMLSIESELAAPTSNSYWFCHVIFRRLVQVEEHLEQERVGVGHSRLRVQWHRIRHPSTSPAVRLAIWCGFRTRNRIAHSRSRPSTPRKLGIIYVIVAT